MFASITIALVLLFLTGLPRNLPNVVLAAIVLVAVKGLIKVADLRRLWPVSRLEFGVSMVALVGVLLLGILEGVVLAAIASVLMLSALQKELAAAGIAIRFVEARADVRDLLRTGDTRARVGEVDRRISSTRSWGSSRARFPVLPGMAL